MALFDKRNWELRRKIKDLQSELAQAEREGKYIVRDGLFFAELEDMGERTMQVFGAGGHAGTEVEIIRTFFERNGFTVAALELDRDGKRLKDAELYPPHEAVEQIVRLLEARGFKVIDDSGREIEPDPQKNQIPLSAVVRTTALLFAQRLRQLIAKSELKMTKEGNRLLSWAPLLARHFEEKGARALIDVIEPAFEEAYNQFYGRIGEKKRQPAARKTTTARSADDHTQPIKPVRSSSSQPNVKKSEGESGLQRREASDPRKPVAEKPASDSNQSILDEILKHTRRSLEQTYQRLSREIEETLDRRLNGARAGDAGRPAEGGDRLTITQQQLDRLMRSEQVAKATGAIYRSLVGANPARCVSNAEAILHHLNRLFQATATCVLARTPHGDAMTIFAQAGRQLVWGEGVEGQGFAISGSLVQECIRNRQIVYSPAAKAAAPTESMVAHKIHAVAAAPIVVGDELAGVLYLDRRDSTEAFSESDRELIQKMADLLSEFHELTLGIS